MKNHHINIKLKNASIRMLILKRYSRVARYQKAKWYLKEPFNNTCFERERLISTILYTFWGMVIYARGSITSFLVSTTLELCINDDKNYPFIGYFDQMGVWINILGSEIEGSCAVVLFSLDFTPIRCEASSMLNLDIFIMIRSSSLFSSSSFYISLSSCLHSLCIFNYVRYNDS